MTVKKLIKKLKKLIKENPNNKDLLIWIGEEDGCALPFDRVEINYCVEGHIINDNDVVQYDILKEDHKCVIIWG